MSKPEKPNSERIKIGVLIGLVVTAGLIYFHQSSGSAEPGGEATSAPPVRSSLKHAIQGAPSVELASIAVEGGQTRSAGRAASREFRPSMKSKPGNAVNPEDFDPTLRTDLLSKLATVKVAHVERSLFDFYTPPVVSHPVIVMGPEPPPPPPPPVVPPPPPAIPLKFYGHSMQAQGEAQKVFCVWNDQVVIPSEGQVVQHRYKVKKILQASVLVEDLEYHHEQTLPIDKRTEKPPEHR